MQVLNPVALYGFVLKFALFADENVVNAFLNNLYVE
jgi:hypothetical protein